eukprot:scaffold1081_cov197-Alexandrium_tamarense.AAC.18
MIHHNRANPNTKFRSFYRKLNRWGFNVVRPNDLAVQNIDLSSDNVKAWSHPDFTRSQASKLVSKALETGNVTDCVDLFKVSHKGTLKDLANGDSGERSAIAVGGSGKKRRERSCSTSFTSLNDSNSTSGVTYYRIGDMSNISFNSSTTSVNERRDSELTSEGDGNDLDISNYELEKFDVMGDTGGDGLPQDVSIFGNYNGAIGSTMPNNQWYSTDGLGRSLTSYSSCRQPILEHSVINGGRLANSFTVGSSSQHRRRQENSNAEECNEGYRNTAGMANATFDFTHSNTAAFNSGSVVPKSNMLSTLLNPTISSSAMGPMALAAPPSSTIGYQQYLSQHEHELPDQKVTNQMSQEDVDITAFLKRFEETMPAGDGIMDFEPTPFRS